MQWVQFSRRQLTLMNQYGWIEVKSQTKILTSPIESLTSEFDSRL